MCNSLRPHELHIAHQASLSFTISLSLLKLTSIESVMPSNHLILFHPLLLLPSVFPSISVFSSESALHIRWPKSWCFSFSISPSNEYSGLISFRIDWFDLLAVHNYGPYGLEPRDYNHSALMPQLLKPGPPRARAQQQEKPLQWEACTPQLESSPRSLQLQKSPHSNKDPAEPINK